MRQLTTEQKGFGINISRLLALLTSARFSHSGLLFRLDPSSLPISAYIYVVILRISVITGGRMMVNAVFFSGMLSLISSCDYSTFLLQVISLYKFSL